MNAPYVRRVAAELSPDPARVIARLFLPGEELHQARSRAGEIVARMLALDEGEVAAIAEQLLADFEPRHADYEQLLVRHASIVTPHLDEPVELSAARTVVLGASFTAEYSVEAAALCNPSAVLHPDQAGLAGGEARVAVSLRGIGEGHMSSIGFCTAIVGPGPQWTFLPRKRPLSTGVVKPARWGRSHFRTVLADQLHLDELCEAVLHALPAHFEGIDLERVLAEMQRDLLIRSGSSNTVDLLRKLASSAYQVAFDDTVTLDQRVLVPAAAEESNGMEDARFTRFVDDDGAVDYRATYTAYDGQRISPRLLTSTDLREFRAHRLAGPAARNKGMALFPRKVDGRFLSLCRSDGESISLASSDDGYVWSLPRTLHRPTAAWEALQVGNCGPPIETEEGWLVLTHGVGPMRSYAIGAILLDLDNPARVVGRLLRPLMEPANDERDGYVPSILYSCGAMLHAGIVWLPLGIDDARISVAYAPLDEMLAAMRPPSSTDEADRT